MFIGFTASMQHSRRVLFGLFLLLCCQPSPHCWDPPIEWRSPSRCRGIRSRAKAPTNTFSLSGKPQDAGADADPDIPIFKQAKIEYAKLQ